LILCIVYFFFVDAVVFWAIFGETKDFTAGVAVAAERKFGVWLSLSAYRTPSTSAALYCVGPVYDMNVYQWCDSFNLNEVYRRRSFRPSIEKVLRSHVCYDADLTGRTSLRATGTDVDVRNHNDFFHTRNITLFMTIWLLNPREGT
jgi:hypothetical protein